MFVMHGLDMVYKVSQLPGMIESLDAVTVPREQCRTLVEQNYLEKLRVKFQTFVAPYVMLKRMVQDARRQSPKIC